VEKERGNGSYIHGRGPRRKGAELRSVYRAIFGSEGNAGKEQGGDILQHKQGRGVHKGNSRVGLIYKYTKGEREKRGKGKEEAP